ncbi:MAG: hypothetical protein OEU26_01545 [Candidatus Tectomicrobia bacterium]|nr:hypothetical protein [Candidatus Tectomicrobia bacterium]
MGLAHTRFVDRRSRRSRHYCLYSYLFMALLLGCVSGLLGCSDELTQGNDTLGDTADRVEQNVLPPLLDESGDVLRNLLNMFPLLNEICATPLGDLGEFTSALPELQRAQQQERDPFQIDESNGSWRASWRDVVFGSADGQTAVPAVDLTITLRFRSPNLVTLQALPFAIAPQSASLTAREPPEPPACTPERPEGFLLFQDAASGVWTLSWCAQETTKTFAGTISAQAITRVLRRLSDDASNEVSSLSINEATTEVRFRETAEPAQLKGFRFFVRPGEVVRLELGLGPSDDTQEINRSQILLGNDQPLPANLEPADFRLATSLPIVPTGAPVFTSGEAFGVFIWQDTANNQCPSAGEDQWRIRFSTPGSTLFEGFARTTNENDGEETRLSATGVGACPAPSIEDDTTLANYECTVQDATPSGYDICATNSQSMVFSSEVDQVRDPSVVSIGSLSARPPAQDPFTILFEVELDEQQSIQNLELTDGVVLLHGDFDDDDIVDTPLRPDQVSLDPLCREPVNPADIHVRLQGQGEYGTERFEGSVYEVDNVEFTDSGATPMVGRPRLPDLGRMILRTRQDNDIIEITAPMEDIHEQQDGHVTTLIDVDLRVDTIQFLFLDRAVNLTVE